MWKSRTPKGRRVAPTSPTSVTPPGNPESAHPEPASPKSLERLRNALRTHAIQPGLKASITEQIAQGMTQPQVRQSIKWVEAQPRTDGQPGKVASSTTTIEYAWLEDDGSIATEFRINFGGGCAMGTKRYKTTDKQYKDLLEHLGGLKPGERKRVPPWED